MADIAPLPAIQIDLDDDDDGAEKDGMQKALFEAAAGLASPKPQAEASNGLEEFMAKVDANAEAESEAAEGAESTAAAPAKEAEEGNSAPSKAPAPVTPPVEVAMTVSVRFAGDSQVRRYQIGGSGKKTLSIGRNTKSDIHVGLASTSWKHAELKLVQECSPSSNAPEAKLVLTDSSSNGVGLKTSASTMLMLKKGVETPLPAAATIILPVKFKREDKPLETQVKVILLQLGEADPVEISVQEALEGLDDTLGTKPSKTKAEHAASRAKQSSAVGGSVAAEAPANAEKVSEPAPEEPKVREEDEAAAKAPVAEPVSEIAEIAASAPVSAENKAAPSPQPEAEKPTEDKKSSGQKEKDKDKKKKDKKDKAKEKEREK